MVTKELVDKCISPKSMILAGVSRNKKKFGYTAFDLLKRRRGGTVYPVNPHTDEIDGTKYWRNVQYLPTGVDRIGIMNPEKNILEVTKQVIDKGTKYIWFQQMADTLQGNRHGKERWNKGYL